MVILTEMVIRSDVGGMEVVVGEVEREKEDSGGGQQWRCGCRSTEEWTDCLELLMALYGPFSHHVRSRDVCMRVCRSRGYAGSEGSGTLEHLHAVFVYRPMR